MVILWRTGKNKLDWRCILTLLWLIILWISPLLLKNVVKAKKCCFCFNCKALLHFWDIKTSLLIKAWISKRVNYKNNLCMKLRIKSIFCLVWYTLCKIPNIVKKHSYKSSTVASLNISFQIQRESSYLFKISLLPHKLVQFRSSIQIDDFIDSVTFWFESQTNSCMF